jgi:hypothetical protein
MAVIPYVPLSTGFDSAGAVLVCWRGLRLGDEGAPLKGVYPRRTIQVCGVFGVLGQVTIEGSLDPEHRVWATLNDPQGEPMQFAVAKLEAIQEGCLWLRPCVSRGDAVTALDVYLLTS